jgi:hypothetical protein
MSGEKKYYLANLPAKTDLRTLAATIKARWICEQAHQQLKEELGLDHFEGRSWQGLRRYALMTMIAYAFLQHRRLAKTRREKRNQRATATDPASRPSGHPRHWPLGTRQRVWLDVLLYTGLRRGDAVRIGKQHVHNGVATLKTEKSNYTVEVNLPILPTLQRRLKPDRAATSHSLWEHTASRWRKSLSAIRLQRLARQRVFRDRRMAYVSLAQPVLPMPGRPRHSLRRSSAGLTIACPKSTPRKLIVADWPQMRCTSSGNDKRTSIVAPSRKVRQSGRKSKMKSTPFSNWERAACCNLNEWCQ